MSDEQLTGGCACGAVRYEISGAPEFEFICHCRHCQQASGSGHGAGMVVSKQALELTGDVTFHDRESDSGTTVSRGFCRKCGCPVLNRNSGYPDTVYVQAGSLDEPEKFSPQKSLFAASAPPWDHVIPDPIG